MMVPQQVNLDPLYRLYGFPVPRPNALDANKILDYFEPPGRGRGRKPTNHSVLNGIQRHARGLQLQPDRVDTWKPSEAKVSGEAPSRLPASKAKVPYEKSLPALATTEARGRMHSRQHPLGVSGRSHSHPGIITKPEVKCVQRHEYDPGEDCSDDNDDPSDHESTTQ